MEAEIIAYSKIKNGAVWANDELLSDTKAALADLTGSLYKRLELNYPKFFKMDQLCKLAILATELVVRSISEFAELPKNKTALVFSNSSSSIESDRNYLNTIRDKSNYFPSPSVFVYTLPNILAGEVAIKHKLTGENAFFISEQMDAPLLYDYCRILLQDGGMQQVICGWVNVDGNNAEAFVFCVKSPNFKRESNGFSRSFDPATLLQLYNL